jgi:hypothetical protein
MSPAESMLLPKIKKQRRKKKFLVQSPFSLCGRCVLVSSGNLREREEREREKEREKMKETKRQRERERQRERMKETKRQTERERERE